MVSGENKKPTLSGSHFTTKVTYLYDTINAIPIAPIIMGLGMIFALFALVFSLGRVVGPLGVLVEEGKRVAEGKPFRPLPEKGPPDLRMLLRAVNQMVSRLEEQQRALRSYAAEVLKAQEEERLRLSRELHDGAVQDLGGRPQPKIVWTRCRRSRGKASWSYAA